MPRSANGTVWSLSEKSRTWSSYSEIPSGAPMAGFVYVDQPAGRSAASDRFTIWVRVEFLASATEYGSVTRLCSTCPVDGANTSTS